jgi:hypothetical protein
VENLRGKSGICWARSGLAYLSFAWKSWKKIEKMSGIAWFNIYNCEKSEGKTGIV